MRHCFPIRMDGSSLLWHMAYTLSSLTPRIFATSATVSNFGIWIDCRESALFTPVPLPPRRVRVHGVAVMLLQSAQYSRPDRYEAWYLSIPTQSTPEAARYLFFRGRRRSPLVAHVVHAAKRPSRRATQQRPCDRPTRNQTATCAVDQTAILYGRSAIHRRAHGVASTFQTRVQGCFQSHQDQDVSRRPPSLALHARRTIHAPPHAIGFSL